MVTKFSQSFLNRFSIITIFVAAMSSSGNFRAEIENLKKEYGFQEPERGDLDDPSIRWRTGKPDYTKVRMVKISTFSELISFLNGTL